MQKSALLSAFLIAPVSYFHFRVKSAPNFSASLTLGILRGFFRFRKKNYFFSKLNFIFFMKNKIYFLKKINLFFLKIKFILKNKFYFFKKNKIIFFNF